MKNRVKGTNDAFKYIYYKYLLCILWGLIFILNYLCAAAKKSDYFSLYIQDKDALVNSRLILSAYKGESLNPIDTCLISEDKIAYFSRGNLPDGMYAICKENEEVLVNFLISSNESKKFGIRLSSHKSMDNIQFKGTRENTYFWEYSILQEKYKNLQKETATEIQFQNIDKEIKLLKSRILEKLPSTTLSFYLKSKSLPSSIENLELNSETHATIMEHYWDNMNFNDERLLRLPILDDKLFDYFFFLLPPESYKDQIKYIDYLADKLNNYPQVYVYCMDYLYHLFEGSPFPNHDEVSIHLLERYLVNSVNISDTYRIFYQLELKRLLMNPIGDTIPNLQLTDTIGNNFELIDKLKEYTVLFFYDPACEICKIHLSELSEYYKHNHSNVPVIIISLDKKTIQNIPEGWISTTADVSEIYSKYNFKGLPSIFFLKNKLIKDKNVSIKKLIKYLDEFKIDQ